ncbi:MAG: CehA/McbA family metallohydrolase [Desulfobacterales bacterium]|nr:CehA/McbA family metallohydrolase [Desulfobacterales bacterium]
MHSYIFNGAPAEDDCRAVLYHFSPGAEARAIRIDASVEGGLRIQLMVWDSKKKLRCQYQPLPGKEPCFLSSASDVTTPECLPGSFPAGKWTLAVIPFASTPAVHRAECSYRVTVTTLLDKGEQIKKGPDPLPVNPFASQAIHAEGRRWYAGDFHTHTRGSDGQMTLAEAVGTARERELDFFTVTDHNTLPLSLPDYGFLVIPGMEVTTGIGHVNLLGIDRHPQPSPEVVAEVADEVQCLESYLEGCKNSDVLVSINHPAMAPWDFEYPDFPLRRIHCLEVICDPTWKTAPRDNLKALDLLTALWNNGYKVWGIGGSDYHMRPGESYEGASIPAAIGLPATRVFAEELSAAAILKSVATGRVIVSCELEISAEFSLAGQRFLPGDTLPEDAAGELTATVTIVNATVPLDIRWVENGRVKASETISGNGTHRLVGTVDTSDPVWVRIELLSRTGELVGFINPVHRGRLPRRIHYWGELAGGS